MGEVEGAAQAAGKVSYATTAVVADPRKRSDLVVRPGVATASADIACLAVAVAFFVVMWMGSRGSYLVWQVVYPLVGLVPVVNYADRLLLHFAPSLKGTNGTLSGRWRNSTPFAVNYCDVRSISLGTATTSSDWRTLPIRFWYPVVCTSDEIHELRSLRSTSLKHAVRIHDRIVHAINNHSAFSMDDRVLNGDSSSWTTIDLLPDPPNRTNLLPSEIRFWRTRFWLIFTLFVWPVWTIYLAYSGETYSVRQGRVYLVPERQRKLAGFIAILEVIVPIFIALVILNSISAST